jgi:hypothetical protein
MRNGYAAQRYPRPMPFWVRVRRFFAALWLGEPLAPTLLAPNGFVVPTTGRASSALRPPQSALRYPPLPSGWRPARFIEEDPDDERLMREAYWYDDLVRMAAVPRA